MIKKIYIYLEVPPELLVSAEIDMHMYCELVSTGYFRNGYSFSGIYAGNIFLLDEFKRKWDYRMIILKYDENDKLTIE